MKQMTPRAELILRLSKEIAREFNQGFVGTEHLLLAILREGSGLGAHIFREQGITELRVRQEIERINKDRLHETWVLGRLPGTPNFKDVVSRAAEAARGSGNWQICSVHLLIALIGEKDSTGYKVLKALGLTADVVRKHLARPAVAR